MKNKSIYNLYTGVFSSLRHYYFNQIIKSIPSSSKILDIGCGQGDFLISCRQKNLVAVGLDIDPKWVKFCQHKKLDVFTGSINNLPFKDKSFDIVFCQSVLEHLHDPVAAVYEIKRVLYPGGTLIISCPTPENHFWDDPTHVRPYTPKSLRLLFQQLGYSQIKINYVFSFLLGLNISWNSLYQFLNLFPFPLGSNLICYAQK